MLQEHNTGEYQQSSTNQANTDKLRVTTQRISKKTNIVLNFEQNIHVNTLLDRLNTE